MEIAISIVVITLASHPLPQLFVCSFHLRIGLCRINWSLPSPSSICPAVATMLVMYTAVCWANKLDLLGKKGLTPPRLAAVAWIPGLAVFLEKKSRRMELALYCSCRVRPDLCLFFSESHTCGFHRNETSPGGHVSSPPGSASHTRINAVQIGFPLCAKCFAAL
jgi:hypothetical protein